MRLAKRYSTDEAAALVNGILAGALRNGRPPAAAGPATEDAVDAAADDDSL